MAVNFAELPELLRYLRHGSFTPRKPTFACAALSDVTGQSLRFARQKNSELSPSGPQ
jgi:hypothetical protein